MTKLLAWMLFGATLSAYAFWISTAHGRQNTINEIKSISGSSADVNSEVRSTWEGWLCGLTIFLFLGALIGALIFMVFTGLMSALALLLVTCH